VNGYEYLFVSETFSARRNAIRSATAQHVRLWRSVLVIALGLYIVAGTYQLGLPGLNYDEALDAVPAMNTVLGQPLDVAASLRIVGREWPLMVMPYLGPTSSLWMIAGFWVGGVSVLALRSTTLALGIITLLLAWGFLRDFLDERVASLTVLLLALNPTYVFWSRMGAIVGQPMLPIAIATYWCLYRWYSRGASGYLIASAFLLGFGLSTKLLFFWVWGALVVAWLVLTPWLVHTGGWRRWFWPVRSAGGRTLPLAAGAAALGSSIVVIYNLQGARAYHFFLDNVARGAASAGTGMEAMSAIPSVGFTDWTTLLNGSWFGSKLGGPYTNPLAVPVVFAAVAVIVGLLAFTGRRRYSPRRLALLGLLMGCFVAEAAATRMSHGAGHLMLVFPVPQVLVAVALSSSADTIAASSRARRTIGLAVLGILAVCIVGAEAWTTYRYERALTQTGGTGYHSDAINALAHDLEPPGTPSAVALDWGFRRNLQILTQNRVAPREWFTYSNPPLPEFQNHADQLMEQPSALYLFHTPGLTAFPGHWEVFERAAYRHRLAPVIWRTYKQRDGTAVYLVYRLEPARRLTALPLTARPLNVRLGDSIALLGYEPPTTPPVAGNQLQVTLYWQSSVAQIQSYKVFATLLDSRGEPWAQHDSIPGDWGYPTTRWQSGEVVADRVWLTVKPDAPAGTYHLFIGMYDPETGKRLPIWSDGQQLKGDTLNLLEVPLQR
jgi:4-amino-4-deoxy-L-arabinose transferase-like glycosyltransferase